ncbi:MAG TPA: hypothetical protein VLO09_07900 [Ornithinimicrobium sp.]|nr:hypothetical protein [Ornithinimicrobium sp.]
MILRRSLERLGDPGRHRVLVTGDAENADPARVVGACGGGLEDVRAVEGPVPVRGYRITT